MARAPPPKWIRRIGCITTTRAEAGIYRPLLGALKAVPQWRIYCFAGGTHPRSEYGQTINELEGLPGVEVVRVDHQASGDSPADVAETAGRAMVAFGRAFSHVQADLLFVLGDRTEMLAAALAAVIHKIPIAHLHGGDLTEGAYDNLCRHALTKLSALHFPALEKHAERIRAMDEEAWRVHVVGALALDDLRDFTPEPPERLKATIGLDFSRATTIVAYHPETLAEQPPAQQISELLAALADLDDDLLFIGPNADVGRGAIDEAVRRFAVSRSHTVITPSLPQRRFWSCLAHARLLVGNSSAGIFEAASFRLPVVNIGHRQAGRLHPANVLDAACDSRSITAAISKASDERFRSSLADLANPYGNGHAADRIMAVLYRLPDRQVLLRKTWQRYFNDRA